MSLDEFETRFVLEYLKDLNGRAAARRAGAQGTDASVASRAWRTLHKAEVQDALAIAMAERNARVQIEADEVLREVHAIATADVNELIEFRRTCCRYCWGEGFLYQRTVGERERDLAAFTSSADALVEAFNERGGIGYDARKEPHVDCPECFGEGVGCVFAKDTRNLSPAARSLYAGAKVTKDGIEIKTHDKVKNLELLARHLGLLNDKLDVKANLALLVVTGVPDDNDASDLV